MYSRHFITVIMLSLTLSFIVSLKYFRFRRPSKHQLAHARVDGIVKRNSKLLKLLQTVRFLLNENIISQKKSVNLKPPRGGKDTTALEKKKCRMKKEIGGVSIQEENFKLKETSGEMKNRIRNTGLYSFFYFVYVYEF